MLRGAIWALGWALFKLSTVRTLFLLGLELLPLQVVYHVSRHNFHFVQFVQFLFMPQVLATSALGCCQCQPTRWLILYCILDTSTRLNIGYQWYNLVYDVDEISIKKVQRLISSLWYLDQHCPEPAMVYFIGNCCFTASRES